MGTIEQMAGGYNISGVDHDPSANIIFYAAHDTNILFLAELLDLKWVFEGWQPNQTPPMGMLVFEVCHWATGFHVWRILTLYIRRISIFSFLFCE